MSSPEILRGMGWFASSGEDGITASVPTGQWDQGELTYAISAADFERLREDPSAFGEIHRSYNLVRGEGWTAEREDKCIVYLDAAKFPDNRRFVIPNESFERLRDDPASFGSIHAAYGSEHI